MSRSRYRSESPLEHPTRLALYEAIESTPGVGLTDLSKIVDVPHSTARHHVRVLTNEGLVVTVKQLGKRRYFPEHEEHLTLTAALSEPSKAAVLHALAIHGEAHGGLLADLLDRDPSTITHHLQALEDAGLVERRKRGRTVVNRLAPFVQEILDVRSDPPTLDDDSGYQRSTTPDDQQNRQTTSPNPCQKDSQRLSYHRL